MSDVLSVVPDDHAELHAAFANSRCLVTGGAGFIGSNLTRALLTAGARVTILDNFSTGFEWAVPPEARIISGDCGDEALLGRIFAGSRVDAVLHFAGSIIVPESVAEPLRYYLNNTVRSRALIEAAVRAGIPHIIFSSTAAVYGTPAVFPVPDYNRQPNQFGHIFAGGYAAGYYSYKWAEVLSADAYAQFEEDGVLNQSTGARFLDEILGVGGSRPAIESFVSFRGRKPEIEALLRHNGMVETADAA